MSDLPDVRPCFDGEQWKDDTLGAWLAGFFDRAGRIALGKRHPVILTVYDLHPQTLSLIQQKLKVGSIEASMSRNGRTLHCWRISGPEQVWEVLTAMLPWLTTQREAAYQALDRIQAFKAEQRNRMQQDREALALWMEGRSPRAIAQSLNISVKAVTKVIARHHRGPNLGEPR